VPLGEEANYDETEDAGDAVQSLREYFVHKTQHSDSSEHENDEFAPEGVVLSQGQMADHHNHRHVTGGLTHQQHHHPQPTHSSVSNLLALNTGVPNEEQIEEDTHHNEWCHYLH
jgi:hypothetical protein